jgi:(p)ppGpp synthase/HD superfamily hydrolase
MDEQYPQRLVEKALMMAATILLDNQDQRGEPLIFHAIRVGLAGATDAERIVGFLHPTVEKGRMRGHDWSTELPPELVAALEAYTCETGEGVFVRLARISENDLAKRVWVHNIADELRR